MRTKSLLWLTPSLGTGVGKNVSHLFFLVAVGPVFPRDVNIIFDRHLFVDVSMSYNC